MTEKPKKAAALNTGVSVIKSKLPAVKPKRQYGDFDEFVALADRIVRTADAIEATCNRLNDDEDFRMTFFTVQEAEGHLKQLPKLKAALAEFEEAREWHDRDEFYERRNDKWRLSLREVSEKIGQLLASIPNSNPGSAEAAAAFAARMIEEVYAARPDACTLESACRHIVRTMKFVSIAEVLKAIDEQGTLWRGRRDANPESGAGIDGLIEYWQGELTTAIATGTARIEEAEVQEKERQKQIAQEEQARRENNARYAREREERIAREAAEREAASAAAVQERKERRAQWAEARAASRAEEAFRDWFQLLMISHGIFIGQHVRYAARPRTITWFVTRLAKGFHPEPSDAFVRILIEQVAVERPSITVDQLESVCGCVLRWQDNLSVSSVLRAVHEAQVQAGELPPDDDDDDDDHDYDRDNA
jgi:hypothetical protein